MQRNLGRLSPIAPGGSAGRQPPDRAGTLAGAGPDCLQSRSPVLILQCCSQDRLSLPIQSFCAALSNANVVHQSYRALRFASLSLLRERAGDVGAMPQESGFRWSEMFRYGPQSGPVQHRLLDFEPSGVSAH